MNHYYFSFVDTADTFNESIQQIQALPKFFEDSVNWGIDASYGALGFMCLLALSVQLFKK
jgi:hypothetical protein